MKTMKLISTWLCVCASRCLKLAGLLMLFCLVFASSASAEMQLEQVLFNKLPGDRVQINLLASENIVAVSYTHLTLPTKRIV